MGFGFKYHVVTVAAIFFALTVGLVVGSLLVSPRVADRQQHAIQSLTDRLNEDLNRKVLEEEQNDKALAALTPVAIKGRLANQRIAIVQTGEYPETTNLIHDALNQAGAQVVSVTAIGQDMDRADEVLLPALIASNANSPGFPTSRATLASAIAGLISRGDIGPSPMQAMLEREGYIHPDPGVDFRIIPKYVVLSAGTRSEASDRISNVDQPLVVALQKLGITVLMCEQIDCHISDVPAYRRFSPGITTIDDIDNPKGRAALIFSMGGETGNYGVKPSATNLLPPELSKFDPR